MTYLLIMLFGIGLGALAASNFRRAVQALILLLPAYLIRLTIGPLPTTLLEIAFVVIFLVWLIKYSRNDYAKIKIFFLKHQFFSCALAVFLFASVVSIFRSDMVIASLGQWRAYFLEPVLVFVVLIARREELPATSLINALGLSTLSVAAFGIYQAFTGFHLPTNDGQIISERTTSLFSSPNAVGLFVVPVLLLVLPEISRLSKKLPKEKIDKVLLAGYSFLYLVNLVVLVLTKSLGSLAGLFGGIIVYLFFIGKRKLSAVLLGLPLLFALLVFVPNREFLATKIRSGGNRVTLWAYSFQYLRASPDNFILGTGIRQFFRKIQRPHYDPKKMERLIYPHNIFLNFWTETGLLGMIGFMGIFGYLVFVSIRMIKKHSSRQPDPSLCLSPARGERNERANISSSDHGQRVLAASFLAVLSAILIHGMVDVPYFKNDLAMLFWIVAAIILS